MKKILLLVGLVLAGVAPARAGIYYDLQQSASSATWRMVGISKWFASAMTGSPTVTIDGANGGLAASSATFTATGNNIFSLRTSSGIFVTAGGVNAPFFYATTGFFGTLFGNAATATLATTATNLASGLVGQTPVQSAAGATTFSPARGNGGLVIGAGTGALPSTGTVTGTANQVVVTNAPGAITLSGPQDLATTSNPSFAALSLSSGVSAARTSSFTATGNNIFSVMTSSGINMTAGTLKVDGPGQFTYSGSSFSIASTTGVYLAGGQLYFASDAAGIRWPDGTTSTTSATSGATPVIYTSSFTNGFTSAITQTSYLVATDTLTVTVPSTVIKYVKVKLGITASSDLNARTICVNVLYNGAYIAPYSATKSMRCSRENSNAATITSSEELVEELDITSVVAAGSQKFQLIFKVSGGTFNIPEATGTSDDPSFWGINILSQ